MMMLAGMRWVIEKSVDWLDGIAIFDGAGLNDNG